MPTINSAEIMDKSKDIVLRLANSDPNNPLTPSQTSFIEQQFNLSFPMPHTLTHPPYSAMIEDAINELNEEGGSNEKSISEFIRSKYEDLPWAHNTYLTRHLRKLCDNGEIVWNSTSKCYTMPASDETQEVVVDRGSGEKNHRKRKAEREFETRVCD